MRNDALDAANYFDSQHDVNTGDVLVKAGSVFDQTEIAPERSIQVRRMFWRSAGSEQSVLLRQL